METKKLLKQIGEQFGESSLFEFIEQCKSRHPTYCGKYLENLEKSIQDRIVFISYNKEIDFEQDNLDYADTIHTLIFSLEEAGTFYRVVQRTSSWDSVELDEFVQVYPKEITRTEYFSKEESL